MSTISTAKVSVMHCRSAFFSSSVDSAVQAHSRRMTHTHSLSLPLSLTHTLTLRVTSFVTSSKGGCGDETLATSSMRRVGVSISTHSTEEGRSRGERFDQREPFQRTQKSSRSPGSKRQSAGAAEFGAPSSPSSPSVSVSVSFSSATAPTTVRGGFAGSAPSAPSQPQFHTASTSAAVASAPPAPRSAAAVSAATAAAVGASDWNTGTRRRTQRRWRTVPEGASPRPSPALPNEAPTVHPSASPPHDRSTSHSDSQRQSAMSGSGIRSISTASSSSLIH